MTFEEYYKQEFEDKRRQSSLKEDYKKTWDTALKSGHHSENDTFDELASLFEIWQINRKKNRVPTATRDAIMNTILQIQQS